MKHEKNERFKTIILTMLIISSLIQSGILWGFMQRGFPFNLLTTILSISTPSLNDKVIKEKFFKPIRIVASEGNYPGTHWIIDSDSDTYEKLWKETMILAKAALSAKPESILPSDYKKWSEIVKKRSFVYEFSGGFNTKLFGWFLDIADTTSVELVNISKIAILPYEDLNNNMTVYMTDDIRTLKFIIPPSQLTRSKYNDILDKLLNSNLVKYNIISELFNGAASIREDLLLVWGAEKSFNTAQSMLPGRLQMGDSTELSSRNNLAQTILGNDHSYDSDIDKYGGIVYVNENNIYKIYEDGYFTYIYRNSASEESKSNVVDSFKNTIEYINSFCERFNITTDRLYLSNVVEVKDYYKFSFNYTLYGTPVLVEYFPKGQENALEGAIEIEANNKRVISCKWLVRDISNTRDINPYNISFQLLANEAANRGINLLRPSSPFVEDIFEAYVLTASAGIEAEITPAWVVKIKDREKIVIPMSSDEEIK